MTARRILVLLALVACGPEPETLGTTRQAITKITFEAESLFLGSGTVALADPAASGGHFIRHDQLGLMAHTDFTSSMSPPVFEGPSFSGIAEARVRWRVARRRDGG